MLGLLSLHARLARLANKLLYRWHSVKTPCNQFQLRQAPNVQNANSAAHGTLRIQSSEIPEDRGLNLDHDRQIVACIGFRHLPIPSGG